MATKEAKARAQRAYRRRCRALGLIKSAAWVPVEDRLEYIEFARELRARRNRALPDDEKV